MSEATPAQMREWLEIRRRGAAPEELVELDQIEHRVRVCEKDPEEWHEDAEERAKTARMWALTRYPT